MYLRGSSDRIVIVCKESEEKLILSLLNQIGWRSKIQSIIWKGRSNKKWHDKALRGKSPLFSGKQDIRTYQEMRDSLEFPATDIVDFNPLFFMNVI